MISTTIALARIVGQITMEVFSYFPAIIEVPYEGIWNIVIEPHLTGRSLPTIGLTVIPRDDNQILD